MPTETAPSAPVPWLGDAANVSEGQSWSSPPSVLTVRYPFNAGRYFRLMGFYNLRLWRLYAAGLLLVAATPTAMFGFLRAPFPPIFIAVVTVAAVIGCTLFVTVTTLILYAVAAVWMRGRRYRVTVSVAGTEHRLEPANALDYVVRIGWRSVVAVTEREGGVLLEKSWGLGMVTVPAEAFTDAEQAARFREAITALWHSRGDFSTVPDAVRREFVAHE